MMAMQRPAPKPKKPAAQGLETADSLGGGESTHGSVDVDVLEVGHSPSHTTVVGDVRKGKEKGACVKQ